MVYMGDDQANDYIYKFVSDGKYVKGGDNSRLLDSGKLYVARFDAGSVEGDFAGTGAWLLLDKQANPALLADAQLPNQAAVLVNARIAADIVGATKMDRPEWVSVHPQTGEVYVTLTNNSSRTQADEANPRAKNVYGQIVRWREAGAMPQRSSLSGTFLYWQATPSCIPTARTCAQARRMSRQTTPSTAPMAWLLTPMVVCGFRPMASTATRVTSQARAITRCCVQTL